MYVLRDRTNYFVIFYKVYFLTFSLTNLLTGLLLIKIGDWTYDPFLEKEDYLILGRKKEYYLHHRNLFSSLFRNKINQRQQRFRVWPLDLTIVWDKQPSNKTDGTLKPSLRL